MNPIQPITVFFAGIGKPTSFISRRILALQKAQISAVVDWDVAPKGMEKTCVQERLLGASFRRFSKILKHPKLFYSAFVFLRKELHKPIKSSIKRSIHLCWIADDKPQIIHAQWTSSAPEFLPLAQYLNIPLIASVRGTQITTTPHISQRGKLFFERALKHVPLFHCVSTDLKQILLQNGVSENRIFVNYNGIDLEKFLIPHQPHQDHKPLEILIIARPYWSKNIESSFLILFELKKQGIPFQCHWLGAGENTSFENLYLQRLDLHDCVSISQSVPQEEIIRKLSSSDVLLSTSIAEGLANVVVEAMACGCIPVVWNCEGMREAIIHEKTGYVFDQGNISSTVTGLSMIQKNINLRKTFSQNGQEHIRTYFDEKAHTQKMIEWYRSTM